MAKPVKVFRAGNWPASIFENEVEKDGEKIKIPKVVFDVGYEDDKENGRVPTVLTLMKFHK